MQNLPVVVEVGAAMVEAADADRDNNGQQLCPHDGEEVRMSMPSSDIEILMTLLSDTRIEVSEMRKENAHEHGLIHEKLNTVAINGTAVSRQNHEAIEKQDKIIDKHEKYINKQVGQVAGITIGTTILIWVGKILLTKVL